MPLRMADASVNAEANALNAQVNGGKLQIYDGTQPATADTAVTTQNKLAEFTLPNPVFGSASAGAVTANAVTNTTGLFAATATWYRVLSSADVKEWDGEAGVQLTLNSYAITVGATISVTSWTHTIPKT
jgi:hypothetical protein